MRPWLLLFAALCTSAPAGAGDAPVYRHRNNIYNQTSLTPIPHARFLNVDAFQKFKQCQARGKESSGCGTYEFTAPYSLDSETVRVGQALRTAWQRLEDRYYWRALVRLNNPLMNLTHCALDWSSGNHKAQAPAIVLNTDNGMVPTQLAGKIPSQQPDDRLKMDRYRLLPTVPNSDYCGKLDPDPSLMYLPGTCVWIGSSKLFCIEGDKPSLNPLAPAPLGFRFDLADARIQKATGEAQTEYTADYLRDVVQALAPNGKFLPLPWSGLNDAIVAPVMKLQPDLAFLQSKAQEAGQALGGVFRATAYAYYLQGLGGPSAALRVHTLPINKDVLGIPNPPGVWKLEEFKRRFPLNNPAMYERFGYTTLFEAWNEVRPHLLPEEASAKPLRQMIYLAVGNNVFLPSPFPVPTPAPMLIPNYSAGLPYAGPQTRFAWVSVAEGYEVPRVKGQPAADYRVVTR